MSISTLTSVGFYEKIKKYSHELAIVLFGLAINLLNLANPGVFSHDELQKGDDLEKYGLLQYVVRYTTFPQDITFSYPVRPLPFVLQGLESYFFRDNYQLFHLAGVGRTILVAFLLYSLLNRLAIQKRVSLVTALAFLGSPLVTLATSWSAALMDQMYVMFGLLALHSSLSFVLSNRIKWLFASALFFTLALLSKETAIVLPAFIVLFLFTKHSIRSTSRMIKTKLAFAWAAPLCIYLIFRFPSIVNSIESTNEGGYNISLLNVPQNIVYYFSYPFMIPVGEISVLQFVNPGLIAIGASIHLGLVLLLTRYFGLVSALFYIFSYFAFLFPLLFIDGVGSHYLFGSAIALATLLGSFLSNVDRLGALLIGLLLLALAAHSLFFQRQLYDVGQCSKKAMESTERAFTRLGSPQTLVIGIEEGKWSFVSERIFFARDKIGDRHPVEILLNKVGEIEFAGPGILIDKNCQATVKD